MPETKRTPTAHAAGRGNKQGPLLLRDRMSKSLNLFVSQGLPGGVDEATLNRLSVVQQTPPSAPSVEGVVPPPKEQGWRVFLPPYVRECCRLKIGPLREEARAVREPDSLVAGAVAYGNQYSWAMPGPCVAYECDAQGVVEWRVCMFVSAHALVERREGKCLARLGVWAAHCHPKERGKYDERTFWDAADAAAEESFEALEVTHSGAFDCLEHDSLKIGVGITCTAAATGNACVSAIATARIAYIALKFRPSD